MKIIETKTKATKDSWGFDGVATYHRLYDWNQHNISEVRVSDTSSGHGWQGIMSKSQWDAL